MGVKLILATLFLAFWVHRFYEAGAFTPIRPYQKYSNCKTISSVSGPEDVVILDSGIALISAGDRRKWIAEGKEKQAPNCGIYKYDLKSDSPPTLVPIKGFSGTFHPHGLSLLQSNSDILLFVVNHGTAAEGDMIIIFKYENDVLNHVKTIQHPLIHSPNEVVAISPNSFYISNDHHFNIKFLKIIEEFLGLKISNVVYYSDGQASEVETGLGMANGLAADSYGRLYVTESTGASLRIYNRAHNGSLTLLNKIPLYSAADNIDLVDNGNGAVTLRIASHPNTLKFLVHAKNAEYYAPSQVFNVNVNSKNEVEVEEVFMSEGKDVSAASVAAYWNKKVIIGAVFDEHFLVCDE